MTHRINRRTALKSLGAMALTPAMARCGGKLQPLNQSIDTVVLVVQENRSFDHYFGTLSIDEGRTDVDGLSADHLNVTSTGEMVHPFAVQAECMAADPPHSWRRSRAQFAEGTNDGFVTESEDRNGPDHAADPMGYLRREQIPIIHTIADHHALCDRWFCSVMGGTWPNRFFLTAGQSGGVKSNDTGGTYDFFNVLDRMNSADRSWGIYYSNLSFAFLFSRWYDQSRFRTMEQFFADAEAGTLPNLTIVEPVYGLSDDHPPAHPIAGQIFLGTVYDALARSPQWSRSTLIITYDEHGGFYDHVPPPKVADERAEEGFDQLGFRVPAVVAGPWIKPGVSSVQFEHTSVLAFLRALFGIRPLTIRDENANDLTQLIDLERIDDGQPLAPTPLPVIEADDAEIYAPHCRHQLFSRFAKTGQPELELYLARHPHPLDRRDRSEQAYDAILEVAERRGLLQRTKIKR